MTMSALVTSGGHRMGCSSVVSHFLGMHGTLAFIPDLQSFEDFFFESESYYALTGLNT